MRSLATRKKDEERLHLNTQKRQHADLRAIATEVQEKRHRLGNEDEDRRESRLESLRNNFAERMETETEERSARLERMSYLQQLRLSTEVDEERAARLENMFHNRELRRSSELDEERADRLGASAAHNARCTSGCLDLESWCEGCGD